MRCCFSRGHDGKGAHVMQPVGEFNKDDADVLGHGDQHFAQVFDLGFARSIGRASLAACSESFVSLVTPSTSLAISGPNLDSMSTMGTPASSGTSWRRAAARDAASSWSSARMKATGKRMFDVGLTGYAGLARHALFRQRRRRPQEELSSEGKDSSSPFR